MSTPEATCAPHDPKPKRPAVAVPPLACDVHAHMCGPNSRYPLIAQRLYTPPEASPQATPGLRPASSGLCTTARCHATACVVGFSSTPAGHTR